MNHNSYEWNDTEVLYLKKLHYQTRLMHQYFNKKHLDYSKTHKKYHIPIMVLSSVNSLFCITLPSFMEQEYVSILNAVLSAGVGILGSILLYLKVDQKMNISYQISNSMSHLSLKISKELSIDKELRSQSGVSFLNECFNEYLSIMENALPIDKKINNFLNLEDLDKLMNFKESSTPSSPLSITTITNNDSNSEDSV
jgi:hypothetical protein